MGFALVTLQGTSVRWLCLGERFQAVPWAKEVEAVACREGVRLRPRGQGGSERVLAPNGVMGLGGYATTCLVAEQTGDKAVPVFHLGPVLRTKSEAMVRAFHMAVLASTVADPVLITGESGTGKELIARAIHDLSVARGVRSGPFLALNMGAIPEDLAEAQMFGWVRGAFTGAVESRSGAFEAANNGTLFLDEVGEASPAIQAKVLRAVEEKTVCRVGSLTPVPVNARLLTATHKNLVEEVAYGRFRLDLYERLACLVVRVPSLRERIEDLPLLATDLLARLPGHPGIEPEALDILRTLDWSGNVRSLRNALHRAAILTLGGSVSTWAVREAAVGWPPVANVPVPGIREPRLTRAEQIARSGLARSTFYYRLRRGRVGVSP